jgi:hypothetical protein
MIRMRWQFGVIPPLFTLLYILRIEIYLDLLFSDIKPVQGLFINSLFWLATLPNSAHFWDLSLPPGGGRLVLSW